MVGGSLWCMMVVNDGGWRRQTMVDSDDRWLTKSIEKERTSAK